MKDSNMTKEKINANYYSLDLTVKGEKTIKVYVYSKDGSDIIPSFYPHKVSHIQKEKDE